MPIGVAHVFLQYWFVRDDVVFERFDRNRIQIDMRVGVVAEEISALAPNLQRSGARGVRSQRNGIYKPINRRCILFFEGANNSLRDIRARDAGRYGAVAGEIVE